MTTIDCRNLSCPAPVIKVKKALEEQDGVRVLLDDGAPRENVTRFARNRGYQVSEERDASGWILTISAEGGSAQLLADTIMSGKIILISSDRLGDGPEELGRLLMKNFIHTLLEIRDLPTRILFINSGVLLTSEGSDLLEALEKLAGMGVDILSCGLCLDFFKLKDKLRAGNVTNMLTIAENLLAPGGVIRL